MFKDAYKINKLRLEAWKIGLENSTILDKYSDFQLSIIYNGIGPESFPDWLRNVISALHPSLEMAALIHDAEWHETDGTKQSFKESNDRFKRNGYKIAKAKFKWYNPRRYIVMNQARRFGNACQMFGWKAWCLSLKK